MEMLQKRRYKWKKKNEHELLLMLLVFITTIFLPDYLDYDLFVSEFRVIFFFLVVYIPC